MSVRSDTPHWGHWHTLSGAVAAHGSSHNLRGLDRAGRDEGWQVHGRHQGPGQEAVGDGSLVVAGRVVPVLGPGEVRYPS